MSTTSIINKCGNTNCSSYSNVYTHKCKRYKTVKHIYDCNDYQQPKPEILKMEAEIVTDEIIEIIPETQRTDGKTNPARIHKVCKWGLKINNEIIKWFSAITAGEYMGIKSTLAKHRAKLALYEEIVKRLNSQGDRTRVKPALQLNKTITIPDSNEETEPKFTSMPKFTKDDIGKWVRYNDGHNTARGRIKSINENFVFVIFHSNDKWGNFKEYTGQACNPEQLTFTEKP